MRTNVNVIVFLIFSSFLTSCGFVVESVTDLSSPGNKLPKILEIPVQPVYLRSNDSYMQAEGSCQGYQVIEFTYSSGLTPQKTVFGKCADDKVSARLDVLQGETKQVFTVKIVGYLSAPTATENLPPSLTVYYTPPVKAIAGFGITSGGRTTSSATHKIVNQSVGEVFIGTQTSAQAKSRNGIQGSIDP